LISSRRSNKVRQHYAKIGGKSPILELTSSQAARLKAEISRCIQAKVFIAMRYWHPLTEETIREIEKETFDRIILLPMYPQYSRTTSGSSLNEWDRKVTSGALGGTPVDVIKDFYNYPPYIDAVVERINEALPRFVGTKSQDIFLLFSAHGVPQSIIDAGDPYKAQVEETVRLVLARGGWKSPHLLCWQSKVGPSVWLKPYLNKTIPDLAARGIRNLLVIPIAFLTDHIETLYEIDIEAREQAMRLGVARFETMPALNDSPTFIKGLAELVLRHIR
jgi:ferrochelatase